MKYAIGNAAELRAVRRTLRAALGLPSRGETFGPVDWDPAAKLELDEFGDPVPTPGWTTDAVDVPLMVGLVGVLSVPDEYAQHLPGVALLDQLALPLPLRAALQALQEGAP